MEKLQQIKEKIAISNGYNGWDDFIGDQYRYTIEKTIDDVAIQYSSELLRQNQEIMEALKHLMPNMQAYAFEHHKNHKWFEKAFEKEIELLTSLDKGKE